jgi:DNA-binding NarL/FixJ family response regulator
MRAILVSVDYDDLLALTLPYNRHHFETVTVITSSANAESVTAICQQHRADVVVTDLFYAKGAIFNKWAALEYGLDRIGRKGWLCLMDADVLWPQYLSESPGVGVLWRWLRPGYLFTVTKSSLQVTARSSTPMIRY